MWCSQSPAPSKAVARSSGPRWVLGKVPSESQDRMDQTVRTVGYECSKRQFLAGGKSNPRLKALFRYSLYAAVAAFLSSLHKALNIIQCPADQWSCLKIAARRLTARKQAKSRRGGFGPIRRLICLICIEDCISGLRFRWTARSSTCAPRNEFASVGLRGRASQQLVASIFQQINMGWTAMLERSRKPVASSDGSPETRQNPRSCSSSAAKAGHCDPFQRLLGKNTAEATVLHPYQCLPRMQTPSDIP